MGGPGPGVVCIGCCVVDLSPWNFAYVGIRPQYLTVEEHLAYSTQFGYPTAGTLYVECQTNCF